MVDSALLAAKIAAARDATARVRAVLPASADAFITDYALAASDPGDVDAFCATLAERARGQA